MLDELSGADRGYALYLVALLVIIFLGSRSLRGRFGKTLAMAGAWVAIFAGLVLVVSYREEARGIYDELSGRFVGELDPARGVVTAEGFRVRARPDGHFWVRGTVSGAPVLFIVDTGATDIVLSHRAARAAGIDPATLEYDRVAMTANGPVRGASVRSGEIVIGPIVRRGLPVAITQGALDVNLLGMSFMRTLSSWRVEGETLIMQP